MSYKHATITNLITILTLTLTVFGCLPASEISDLSIRNGIHLEAGDKNTAPGLVAIGGCSATLVSTNTLMTAAHCVSSGQRVCVRSGDYTGTCSNNTYLPQGYRTQNGRNMGYDVAIVVFEGAPFKNFFRVATTSPRRGDPVVMVGYSTYRNNEPGRGSKRWGRNNISSFDGRELNSITTYDGGSSDKVAVDKGDSGGTMLNSQCELIGVTSRNCGDSGRCSIHTNITHEGNHDWLVSQIENRGAQICGLSNTDSAYCPASGMATVDANPAQESDGSAGFPCAPSSQGLNGQGLGDDGKIKIGLASGSLGNVKMYVSIPGADRTVAACANVISPEQCSPILSANHFAGQKIRSSGSRGIFLIPKEFDQNGSDTTWTLVARDAAGSIKQVRKFKLAKQ